MLTVTLTITGEDLQMIEQMLEEAMDRVRQGRKSGFEGDSHSGYDFTVAGQVGSWLDDDNAKSKREALDNFEEEH